MHLGLGLLGSHQDDYYNTIFSQLSTLFPPICIVVSAFKTFELSTIEKTQAINMCCLIALKWMNLYQRCDGRPWWRSGRTSIEDA